MAVAPSDLLSHIFNHEGIFGTLLALDHRITRIIHELEVGPFEYLIYPGCILFGWKGMPFFILPLIFIFCGFQVGVFMLFTIALGQSINQIIKRLVLRPRPIPPEPRPHRTFHLWKSLSLKIGDGPSFPSGDTMAAGTVGGVLIITFDSWWPLLIPLWGALGRQYFWFHFFFDTFIGGLIGVSSAFIVDAIAGGYESIDPMYLIWATPLFFAFMGVVMFKIPSLQSSKKLGNKQL